MVNHASCGGVDSRKTREYMYSSTSILIVECYVSYVQGLMQNYYRVSGLTRNNISILTECIGKVVYILPSSYSTLVLLLVRFTEYDDHDDKCY
ncbi:hypothetical protein Hanom_Chr02g00148851 [Helianthus anomalus]